MAQIFTNFDAPSIFKKEEEALRLLETTGQTQEFNSLTKQINIVNKNGSLIASDAATGQDIVKVGEVNARQVPANAFNAADASDRTTEFKVIISSQPQLDTGTFDVINTITFDVMPSIQENRNVSYKAFNPLHHPGEILKYDSTSSVSWSVNATLISRTVSEASRNLQILNTIRSWAMPFYGQGTAETSPELLGSPPPILTLSAYGEQMIGPAKCVLENYSWSWPNDVDYIQTESKVPFPVILHISLSLKETWSPAEYSSFDLLSYRYGNLPAAFNAKRFSQVGQTPKNKQAQAILPVDNNYSNEGYNYNQVGNYSNEGRNYSRVPGNDIFTNIVQNPLGDISNN